MNTLVELLISINNKKIQYNYEIFIKMHLGNPAYASSLNRTRPLNPCTRRSPTERDTVDRVAEGKFRVSIHPRVEPNKGDEVYHRHNSQWQDFCIKRNTE